MSVGKKDRFGLPAGLRLNPFHLVAETRPGQAGKIKLASTATVDSRMHPSFQGRGFGVKLHPVALDPHDRSGMRSEKDVRNLGKHRVGQILDHQVHPVGLGPASAEDGAGLRLARLERDPGPAEFAAEPDQLPVMRALVEKQRLAGGDAVDIDAVGL